MLIAAGSDIDSKSSDFGEVKENFFLSQILMLCLDTASSVSLNWLRIEFGYGRHKVAAAKGRKKLFTFKSINSQGFF